MLLKIKDDFLKDSKVCKRVVKLLHKGKAELLDDRELLYEYFERTQYKDLCMAYGVLRAESALKKFKSDLISSDESEIDEKLYRHFINAYIDTQEPINTDFLDEDLSDFEEEFEEDFTDFEDEDDSEFHQEDSSEILDIDKCLENLNFDEETDTESLEEAGKLLDGLLSKENSDTEKFE